MGLASGDGAVGVAVGVGVGVADRDGVDHSISSSAEVPDSIAASDRADVPTDDVLVDDVDDVVDVEVGETVGVGIGWRCFR